MMIGMVWYGILMMIFERMILFSGIFYFFPSWYDMI